MLRLLVIDADASRCTELEAVFRQCAEVESVADVGSAQLLLTAESWDVVLLVAGALTNEKKLVRQLRRGDAAAELVVVVPDGVAKEPYDDLESEGTEVLRLALPLSQQLPVVQQAVRRAGLARLSGISGQREAELEALRSRVDTASKAPTFANLPAVLFRQHSTTGGISLFSYISPNVETLLGVPAKMLLQDGAAFDELVHPDDFPRLQRARARATALREGLRFQGRFFLPCGRVRSFEMTATLVASAGPDTIWDGMVTDVTERTELQSQLFLADRMATVGTMAASLTHEVNNPLFFVTANLSTLQAEISELGAPARLVELLTESISGVETISQAVSNFRTFARSSGEEERSLDLAEVVAAAVRMAHNEIRHRATLELSGESGVMVFADESALAQVFLTLLVFCAQSIEEGHAEQHRIVIKTEAQGEYAVVSLVATGASKGVSLNEPARSETNSGLERELGGTSLYVCHRIVSTLGGEIRLGAVATEASGDQVTITLPLAHDAVPRQAIPSKPRSERKLRVLAVDDEELVLKALGRALNGHEVLLASSGREAIELLQTRGPFDLILCDVMMPDLTGADVFSEVRRAHPGTERRIVFVTGGAFTSSAREFLDSVPNRRIEKPFSVEVIQSLLPE